MKWSQEKIEEFIENHADLDKEILLEFFGGLTKYLEIQNELNNDIRNWFEIFENNSNRDIQFVIEKCLRNSKWASHKIGPGLPIYYLNQIKKRKETNEFKNLLETAKEQNEEYNEEIKEKLVWCKENIDKLIAAMKNINEEQNKSVDFQNDLLTRLEKIENAK